MLNRIALTSAIVIVLAMIILPLMNKPSDRYYTIHSSINRAQHVIEACRHYRDHSESGGNYPKKIDDLNHPAWDKKTYLEDPERDVVDYWGHPFKYAVIQNEAGQFEAFVWTEWGKGRRTQLIGAKAAADGTVVLFGLPE